MADWSGALATGALLDASAPPEDRPKVLILALDDDGRVRWSNATVTDRGGYGVAAAWMDGRVYTVAALTGGTGTAAAVSTKSDGLLIALE